MNEIPLSFNVSKSGVKKKNNRKRWSVLYLCLVAFLKESIFSCCELGKAGKASENRRVKMLGLIVQRSGRERKVV